MFMSGHNVDRKVRTDLGSLVIEVGTKFGQIHQEKPICYIFATQIYVVTVRLLEFYFIDTLDQNPFLLCLSVFSLSPLKAQWSIRSNAGVKAKQLVAGDLDDE
ncbi:hypothetical protein IW262DRAFT_1301290 [Armillaria fumosa]|nr:hypothetical protein IW262DRAFT_1301290 [Armillaria fumosa]